MKGSSGCVSFERRGNRAKHDVCHDGESEATQRNADETEENEYRRHNTYSRPPNSSWRAGNKATFPRLAEHDVRFVQVYSGDTGGWDAHNNVLENHTRLCRATDRPMAGLIHDLKRRGLWDDTLLVIGGEFGRMPMSEKGTGRDHNPWGYSLLLAGGPIRGGTTYGSTDPIGLRAAHNPIHIRDLHATLLHILGLDHESLTFFHNGLEEKLTGVEEARVVKEVFV